jgi:hypothetical protein
MSGAGAPAEYWMCPDRTRSPYPVVIIVAHCFLKTTPFWAMHLGYRAIRLCNALRVELIGELQSIGAQIQENLMAEKSNPPTSDPRVPPVPREKLVKVFDSERESEALVVSGLLESAGIDSDVTSTDAAQNMYPGVGGSVILVREDQAEEARRVIEAYRQADDTAEIDISEEPPPAQ